MKKFNIACVMRWMFLAIILCLAAIFAQDVYVTHGAYAKAKSADDGYFQTTVGADLTVVEFLSYNCGYCKDMNPILTEAIRRDGRITYVPKPVLMEDEAAVLAAKAVYAAGLQGGFLEMHHALLENTSPIDENLLLSLSLKLGLDGQELIDNLENSDINDTLIDNTIALTGLSGTGTPSFLIGERIFFPGMERIPSVDDFLRMFEESRNL